MNQIEKRSYKQELKQSICQKYGWSCVIIEVQSSSNSESIIPNTTAPTKPIQNNNNNHNDPNTNVNSTDDHNRIPTQWICTIYTGYNQKHIVTSTVSLNDVCQQAIIQLQPMIQEQESKYVTSDLSHVFHSPIDIYDSYEKENWVYFWKNKPKMVGIDTEGNNISPPVLVQIATLDPYCLIEAPKQKYGSVSYNLQRLLKDTSIIKVFCDNFAHKDKKSLGIKVIPNDLTTGHIIDIEALANIYLGPVKSARGLGRIVSLCMPELNVRISKPKENRFHDIGHFTLIEQGKCHPLRTIYDLSTQELQYAALDAYATLKVYERFCQYQNSQM